MTASEDPGVPTHQILTHGPAHEPLGVRLYVQKIRDRWTAMLLADEDPPPEPGVMTGLACFGATPEEAEQAAEAYLGCAALGH
jgi:hypothetical protein